MQPQIANAKQNTVVMRSNPVCLTTYVCDKYPRHHTDGTSTIFVGATASSVARTEHEELPEPWSHAAH